MLSRVPPTAGRDLSRRGVRLRIQHGFPCEGSCQPPHSEPPAFPSRASNVGKHGVQLPASRRAGAAGTPGCAYSHVRSLIFFFLFIYLTWFGFSVKVENEKEEQSSEIKINPYDNLPIGRKLIDKKNSKVGIFDLGNHILINYNWWCIIRY